jgi:hypothetical protein
VVGRLGPASFAVASSPTAAGPTVEAPAAPRTTLRLVPDLDGTASVPARRSRHQPRPGLTGSIVVASVGLVVLVGGILWVASVGSSVSGPGRTPPAVVTPASTPVVHGVVPTTVSACVEAGAC